MHSIGKSPIPSQPATERTLRPLPPPAHAVPFHEAAWEHAGHDMLVLNHRPDLTIDASVAAPKTPAYWRELFLASEPSWAR